MTTDFNFGGGAGPMMGMAAMFGNVRQQNAQLADRRDARDQNMLQFMMQRDSADRQMQMQNRQLSMQQNMADRQFAAQREESAFARLNQSLEMQMKIADREAANRDRAFEMTMRSKQFELQTRMQMAQVQELEREQRRMDDIDTLRKTVAPALARVQGLLSVGGAALNDALVEAGAAVDEHADKIGLSPELQNQVNLIRPLMQEYSTPVFPIAGSEPLKPSDVYATLKKVNPADGFDADERQVLAQVFGGFSFTGDSYNDLPRITEYLNTKYKAGSETPDSSVSGVVMTWFEQNPQSVFKFLENGARGAFEKSLDVDQVSSVQSFAIQQKALAQQAIHAATRSGELGDKIGEFVAEVDARVARRVDEYAMSLAGVRDPSALQWTRGRNNNTREIAINNIEQAYMASSQRSTSRVFPITPGGKARNEGAMSWGDIIKQSPAADAVRGLTGQRKLDPDVGALYSLRQEIAGFYGDYVDRARSNPALVRNPDFLREWEAQAATIAANYSDRVPAYVVTEQLSLAKNLPGWTVKDADLQPLADRLVPGYKDNRAVSPTEALMNKYLGNYTQTIAPSAMQELNRMSSGNRSAAPAPGGMMALPGNLE